ERRFTAHVAFEAQHADGRVLVEEWRDVGARLWVGALFFGEVTRRIVRGQQQAEGIAPGLAGQLDGVIGIDDRARVDGLNRRLKEVYAFEEERALFGEEDREALVGRDHWLIGFDLREVRVDREVERHVRGEAELDAQAGIGFERLVDEA